MHTHFANFIAGVTQAASGYNWTVTIAAEPSGQRVTEALTRLVDERKADGFILLCTLTHDRRVEALKTAGVPFTMFGRTEEASRCAW
ncbi:MAG: hypothetical protein AAFP13_13385 [Pseudomonadota bacterium]